MVLVALGVFQRRWKNPTNIAAITAKAYPKKGDEFYLCNPMDELIAAMYAGDRFVAHAVIGMVPKRVIIDPQDIARIEEV